MFVALAAAVAPLDLPYDDAALADAGHDVVANAAVADAVAVAPPPPAPVGNTFLLHRRFKKQIGTFQREKRSVGRLAQKTMAEGVSALWGVSSDALDTRHGATTRESLSCDPTIMVKVNKQTKGDTS